MRRRITLAIVAVTSLAVALFGLPLAFVIHRLYLADARTRLEREATVMARDVPADFATVDDPLDLPSSTQGILVGLYRPTGERIAGDGPATADRAVRDAVTNTIHSLEAHHRLIAAVPVAVNEQIVAVVRAETSTHPAERRAHLAWALMAALGAVVVGLAGTLAIVQANRLTRPLRRVRDAAARLGHGDYRIGVPHAGVRELDDLADALTSTAQRLGNAMQRERDLTTHASHQLRTPIAGLRVTIESELAVPRADSTLALQECLTITDRLETTVTDLIRLAREPADSERLSLGALVDHVRTHWRGPLAAHDRRLVLPNELPDAPVLASNAAITQALDILIDNAVRHGRGTVTLATEAISGGIVVSVTDEGPGPPLTNRARPRPGASLDDGGLGIGLDLATTLVEAEGGRLKRPQPERSATFAIVLATVAPRSWSPS